MKDEPVIRVEPSLERPVKGDPVFGDEAFSSPTPMRIMALWFGSGEGCSFEPPSATTSS